ncbi:MAG: cob(I)yrinic acid a,c-diamide adenosyltransferase [Dysgonamonadaceae bacterium]
MKENGLVHVYTGDGKGKSTAAVGLALRALGHGQKVCYCSFHKNPEKYRYKEIEKLQQAGADIFCFAKDHPHLDRSLDETVIRRETYEGVAKIRCELYTASYDLIILDEILISVRDHFLEEELLTDLIRQKPETVELVLTGRGASDVIIALADYVSDVRNLKHPYDERKIGSREGIEY